MALLFPSPPLELPVLSLENEEVIATPELATA